MPLRFPRLLSTLSLAALMATLATPSNAQSRGALASRAMPLRLTLSRYGAGNDMRFAGAPRYQAPRYQAPRYQAPRYQTQRYQAPSYRAQSYQAPRYQAPRYQAPQYQNLGRTTYSTPVALRPPSVHPIALGAYFYQDGQCAPGDRDAVSAWKARTGRMPAVWMIYQGWTGWNQFPVSQARKARQLGGQLLVTWEPWDGRNAGSNWSCALVANGVKDDYIRSYARAVRSSGVPVMIRFAHEMNGDWYPWATAYQGSYQRHNGNTPANFVAMWRHVVQIFRQEGATNASWVWAPNIHYLNNCNSVCNQNADLAALYPGDNYVNWIGLSIYNDGSRRNWRSFSDLFDGAYRTVTSLTSKPLMIAEMGVTEAGAPYGTSKASWISQTLMSDIPRRYPRVQLVNWFCRDKSGLGEANYRFDSSPASLQAFRVAVNSPLYSGRLR